jgi:hypothetical protein
MTANVSIWIRAFRLPLQRAYPRQEELQDTAGIDADLDRLLHQADKRLERSRIPACDDKSFSPR